MTKSYRSRRDFLRQASALSALTALGACQGRSLVLGKECENLRLAKFRCDVTPKLGTPIYSSFKPLETIEHPLLAKGIVLEIQGTRYVLCAVDWCELRNSTYNYFRNRIAKAAQTSPANVAVQCVHQHTAPMADGDAVELLASVDSPPSQPSKASFEAGAGPIVAAVGRCLETFEPFDRIGVGQGKVECVASNRRISIGGGKVGFRGSSCNDPAVRALPEGLIDPYVKSITLSRGGHPLVRLHYYATHPQSFYNDPRASFDFPGIVREALQAKEEVFHIYFTGCAGDIAAGKYNDGTPPARTELAKQLRAGMEASIASTVYHPVDRFSWRTHPVTFTARNDSGFTMAECRAKMADVSLSSNHRLGAAMVLAWHTWAKRPIEFSALRLGDVHILHLPGEPMIEYQLFAQRLRPGQTVAVAGYGDGGPGYICTERAYAEGGYEPTASNLIPESESLMRDAIRRLLGVA